MTKEEKQILLNDLSARIPYQPLCKKIDTEDDFCECDGPLGYSLRDFVGNKVIIKPYLRSMSSMTEEERRYLLEELGFDEDLENGELNDFGSYVYRSVNVLLLFDWLNAHHFDYRGLIPMGLALEAPEEMYKTE
jgi:hypothetical protein